MVFQMVLKELRSLVVICCTVLAVSLWATPALAEHRDPAPIPADVVQQLTKDRHQPDNPLAVALARHLDEAEALLDDMEEADRKADSESVISSKRMLMEGKMSELATVREEVRRYFAETRSRLVSLGLEDKAKEWDGLLAEVEKRFDRVNKAMADVHKASDKGQRGKALGKAKQELYDLHGKVKEQAGKETRGVGAAPIPEPVKLQEPPQQKGAPIPAYLSQKTWPRNNVYAFLGNTLLAPPDTPAEAQSCNYTTADKGASQEIQLTDEIKALAAELGYAPARIYEYVYNNIKFEPYYGSLKGAQGTLISGGGNATDQASLLIALLRASNIPARYVKGLVYASGSQVDNRLGRWVGAKNDQAGVNILWYGGIPAYSDQSFTHVWVEACVPYAHYRGAKVDNAGHRWIPLDPSFKDKKYQEGIAVDVNFDYDSYLSARTDVLPHEAYEQVVEAAAKTMPLSYGNNTLKDVPFSGTIVPRKVDILPASLPYKVVSFTAWGSGNTSAEVAEVPDSHRLKYTITIKTTGGTVLLSKTLSLPETLLRRITLSFKGADSNSQLNLDRWRNDGNDNSGVLYVVYFFGQRYCTVIGKAVVKVDGVPVAESAPFNMCDTALSLEERVEAAEVSLPFASTSHAGPAGLIGTDYYALQVYAFQGSDRLLTSRAAKLLDAVKTTTNANTNDDETIGEFLHLVGLKYMRYITDANKQISFLTGAVAQTGIWLGHTQASMKVHYLFDLPFAVSGRDFVIDVRSAPYNTWDINTGASKMKATKMCGFAGSSFESYIWQENAGIDAMCTVRGLQFANETGIPVITLDANNWATESPKLTNNTSMNYTSSQVSTIKSWIDKGYTVTLPRRQFQYSGWSGHVYMTEKADSCCGSMVGGYGGGVAITSPDTVATYNYWTDTTLTYLEQSFNNIMTDVPLSLGNGAVGQGQALNTWAGDPVNMVTGNVYHTERDISIKSRGGLPIVFERSYNSRAAQDGPLGFGWTHSFNHFLYFRDDNANGTADNGDSDNITSSVSWVDGTGSEKIIKVSGTSAGVAIGSTFTPPSAFFFTMSRNADGTYTIREKNGLTYTFENVAGTKGQKAKLTSIKDRNGNSLTLNYSGGNLSSVVDGLGRSLTFIYSGSRIIQVSDWSGRAHQYEYDASGNLWKYKNPLVLAGKQNPVVYEYYTSTDGVNLNHAMKKYTLPKGNGMTFEYYANGRAFRHYNTLGETNTFTYNDFRRETVSVNERGFTRRFFFDKYGNPLKIVEENGGEREYTYDPNKPYNRLSKKDPMGYQTQYVYDANGNVTKITNPSGSTVESSYFNAFNQPGKVKDANGNYTIMKYDAKGNLLQEIRLKSGIGAALDPAAYTPVSSDIASWTINIYDAFGNLKTTKRVRDFATQAGPTVEYAYDAQNLYPISVTRKGDKDGDGAIVPTEYDMATLTYDNLGRLKNGIDGDWQATQFTYDDVDRVIKGTDAFGNLRNYLYDANGNATGQKLTLSVNGTPTLVDSASAVYDASDRKEKSVDSGGFVTAYQYDAGGNVINMTNPDNYTLGFEYDENNHVIKAYDQENNAVTRTLDLDGKTRTVTDPNGNTVKYEYYASERDGRLKKTTDAANRATTFDYDMGGNVTTVIDNLGRATTTTYDEMNRPVRIVGPSYTDATYGIIRPVTKYAYDNLSNLIRVDAGRTDSTGTNPASDVVTTQMTYAYDDFGRKLKEADALGKFWAFEYDVNNNVTKITDTKGQITQYTWGYGHQLMTRISAAGTLTYTRNALGQPLTAQLPEVTYTYGYDANYRTTSVNDSRGNKTLSYNYSPGGLLNWMSDSDGNRTDYLYDAVGRLIGIFAPNYEYATFRYDAGGRLTEKWFPNGVNAQYQYNADNTLKQVVNRTSTSVVISQHDYTYDGVGNRRTHTEMIGGTTMPYKYVYDELNRLTEVRNNTTAALIEGYSYDPLGNRLTKTDGVNPVYYIYDAANQLKEIRQGSTTGAVLASMLYDDNGNMTTKTEGATTTSMVYDALNRLAQVSKTGQSTQNYQYDDQGRRISKTVGAVTTNFLYSGPDIVAEYTSWTAPNAQYTHGPNMDDPIIRQEGVLAQYYHQDGLGSVVGLSNSADSTAATQRFDVWGNKTASSGNVPQYGYTGREPDATGLMYYRARYYDSTIGRFTQRDPIGLRGGINQYAYVGNNPANSVDPSGLVIISVHGTDILGRLDRSATAWWRESSALPRQLSRVTGDDNRVAFEWSGGNSDTARKDAALELAGVVNFYLNRNEPVSLALHSHAVNVGAIASHYFNGPVELVVAMGGPVRPEYEYDTSNVKVGIALGSPEEQVQNHGGGQHNWWPLGEWGSAGRMRVEDGFINIMSREYDTHSSYYEKTDVTARFITYGLSSTNGRQQTIQSFANLLNYGRPK